MFGVYNQLMFISKAFADALVLGSTRSLADTMLIQCDAVIARLIFSPNTHERHPVARVLEPGQHALMVYLMT